ncbi:MAG: hypothetical protein J5774_01865 [Clostridia bacterium]|nr:hypothetical protein [Clostridia bacterium]
MDRFKRPWLVNLILIGVCLSCYVALAIIIYKDVGFWDWNFQNALPTANVSPFMFCSLALYVFFLPKKIRKYHSVLIALLSAGMFGAVAIACVSRAVIRYKFHFSFVLDYLSHLSLSLFGIYLVRSEQVELKKRDCLIAGGALFSVAVIMLIINAIFGTAYFGLALNEKYNIYNMVLAPNAYLSAALYFVCLVLVLTIGYFYVKFLTAINSKTHEESSENKAVD